MSEPQTGFLPPGDAPERTYLSKREAALRLRVHPNTLDNWAMRDYGPPRARVGRKIVYRTADLDDWIDTQVKAPAVLQHDEGPKGQGIENSTHPQDTEQQWIEKWLAVAPPMTAEQRARIAGILRHAG